MIDVKIALRVRTGALTIFVQEYTTNVSDECLRTTGFALPLLLRFVLLSYARLISIMHDHRVNTGSLSTRSI
jgi:hypothetical protein